MNQLSFYVDHPVEKETEPNKRLYSSLMWLSLTLERCSSLLKIDIYDSSILLACFNAHNNLRHFLIYWRAGGVYPWMSFPLSPFSICGFANSRTEKLIWTKNIHGKLLFLEQFGFQKQILCLRGRTSWIVR